jgi:hypothetical protein
MIVQVDSLSEAIRAFTPRQPARSGSNRCAVSFCRPATRPRGMSCCGFRPRGMSDGGADDDPINEISTGVRIDGERGDRREARRLPFSHASTLRGSGRGLRCGSPVSRRAGLTMVAQIPSGPTLRLRAQPRRPCRRIQRPISGAGS